MTDGGLAKYDSARRALAEARTVIEVKDVRDKAEALRGYARLAKDRTLEIEATEVRVRAERRLGQMLIELAETSQRAGRGRPKNVTQGNVFLADLKIDRKLSMQAQKLAAVDEAEFERRLAEWRDTEARRTTRAISSLIKAVARPMAPAEPVPLPAGKFGAVHADPAWRFGTWSEAGMDRAPDIHYPTMTIEEIAALGPALDEITADDCALFLWVYTPLLPDAFHVIASWGFVYKTIALNWVKDGAPGKGYWTRQRSEICLLATRGQPKRLNADVDQVITEPRRENSRKPDETLRRIERLVDGPYIDLFARQRRPGWAVWGNEIDKFDPSTGSG